MTSLRRYVIEIQNFHSTKRFALVQSIFSQNFAAISPDISNIERVRGVAVKWRNDVMTSLCHRKQKNWLHQKMCLGPIYNPCKFRGDISTIKRVRGFSVKWRNVRHRMQPFWLHQKTCLGPIYNTWKFGGDISTIERVKGFALKWRNEVMTSLRHRNSKTKSVITPALVQSIIPQSLVAIS